MAVVNSSRWQQLQPLLDQALELSGEERGPWLDALRVSSPELASEVMDLLASEESANRQGFLLDRLDVTLEGMQVGAYTIEKPIGHGGMGSVWLARRSDGRFEGHAAVKILNLSLLTATGQERFRREGSLLARLSHPGIARLLDAGVSPTGQPYLLLEYVEGERIDEFVRTRRPNREQLLELFLAVVAAVAHAPSHLVVHRDLKPSNILVRTDGTVKLLDFGIAKLLDATEPGVTADGVRALTPAFAAPEQVQGGQITTATDVYALGILLYILLSGRHPGAQRASSPEVPARDWAGQPFVGLGAGDLDSILAKALQPEAARRYQTVEALADDLERFRKGAPVVARPDSFAYRTRRFVVRNWGLVTAAAVGLVLLTGAALRERTLRARAETEVQKTEAVKNYLLSVFNTSDPFTWSPADTADVTARQLLDRGVARIDSLGAGQADIEAELRVVLARVYANLGLYDKAAPLLLRALEQRRAIYGPRHLQVAQVLRQLGDVRLAQNQLGEADTLLRAALEQHRALVGPDALETAESLDRLATLLQERSHFDSAATIFAEALAINRRRREPADPKIASSAINLGLALYLKGDYTKAGSLYREALAMRPSPTVDQSTILHNLAQVEMSLGNLAAAETLYRSSLDIRRRLVGNKHPRTTININNLAKLLREEDKLPEAESLAREALSLDALMFKPPHNYLAEDYNALATILRARGQLDSALAYFKRAHDMHIAVFGPRHYRVALDLNSMGSVLRVRGHLDSSIVLFRQSLDMMRTLLGPTHRTTYVVTGNLAAALRERGRLTEAGALARDLDTQFKPNNRTDRPALIQTLTTQGRVLTDLGRPADARPVLERALNIASSNYGLDHWRTGEPLIALGVCLFALGDVAAADSLVGRAVAVLQPVRAAHPHLLREAARLHQRFTLGRPGKRHTA